MTSSQCVCFEVPCDAGESCGTGFADDPKTCCCCGKSIRDFSCPDCQFDPDGSLVMCAKHDRMLRPLSVESLRMLAIDLMESGR